jgi:DNA-binding transcriptional ArsR family regulator
MTPAKILTGAAATAEAVLEALAHHAEATAAELAEATGIGRSTAAKALGTLEAEGKAQRLPGGREGGRRRADRWTMPEAVTARRPARSQPTQPSTERLRPGALGEMVVEYLMAHGTEALGPTAVGKALGRSQGAVANALGRLAEAGTVVVVSDSPRRYRLADR